MLNQCDLINISRTFSETDIIIISQSTSLKIFPKTSENKIKTINDTEGRVRSFEKIINNFHTLCNMKSSLRQIKTNKLQLHTYSKRITFHKLSEDYSVLLSRLK